MKGTVVILPGRNECIEKYFETIRDLSGRGLGSALIDWRGQGDSDRLIRDRQRGHVKRFSDYADDLEQFFEEVVLPDCRGPYYILAHSAGALIAPFLALPGQRVSTKTMRRITTVLCLLGLGRLYAAWGPRQQGGTPFEANKVTSDPARYARNTLLYETWPQLALGGPTIGWLRAASKASGIVSAPEFMAAINVPTLVIAAGADRDDSTRAVESYARHLRLGALLTIDGAAHEILQEADLYREQFFAAFDAFIPSTDDDTL
jgi:lysophospholipase